MTAISVTSHEAVPKVQPLTGMESKEEAMPLPKWLMRVYYIFPIILYIPDVIFNYFVYSKGVSTPFDVYDIATYPENALWLFLALGIVGMAWLLSILAPWHWIRNNKFQSVMCWFGVLIATAITTWNSLAYRMSQTNSPFPTDKWIADTFHINLPGFSPTTILVSISPPFWGLFWAIVQPAERRRSAHEEQQSHEARMLKIQLDAEMKAAKANANATVREAQLKGLAASMKAARSQIGAVVSTATESNATSELADEETIVHEETVNVVSVADSVPSPTSASSSSAVVADTVEPSLDTESAPASATSPAFPRGFQRSEPTNVMPPVGDPLFSNLVRDAQMRVKAKGLPMTIDAVIEALADIGYQTPGRNDLEAVMDRIAEKRLVKRR